MKSETRCQTMYTLLCQLKPQSRAEAASFIGALNMLRWVLDDDGAILPGGDLRAEELAQLYQRWR